MKAVQSIVTADYLSPSCKSRPPQRLSCMRTDAAPPVVYHITVFWIFVLAEPNATIIAASIPSLRGLVRDVRNNYANQYNSPNAVGYLRSTNSKFRVHPSQNLTAADRNGPSTDASSDKSILGQAKMGNGIERTTEITVDYDMESRHGHDDAYEMHARGAKPPPGMAM